MGRCTMEFVQCGVHELLNCLWNLLWQLFINILLLSLDKKIVYELHLEIEQVWTIGINSDVIILTQVYDWVNNLVMW